MNNIVANDHPNRRATPIRIELPFAPGGGSVNVYLFREPEPMLIDAGYKSEEAWQVLTNTLAEHRFTVADLKRVIITHPHVDHYGFAARIANTSNATIGISEVGIRWLADFPTQWQQRIDYYRTLFLPGLGLTPEMTQAALGWMQRTWDLWEPIPVERIVAFPLNQDLQLGGLPWQVLHTLGHDSHLTCFYQPATQQLLSADMLMIPTATAVVDAPKPGAARQPALPHFVTSLERLATLNVETVYPGHGAPFGNHRAIIQAQLARIHERKEECYRHVAAAAATVAAIAELMYGARLGQVGLAAFWMVVGYLDLLQKEGRVEVDARNAVWQYQNR